MDPWQLNKFEKQQYSGSVQSEVLFKRAYLLDATAKEGLLWNDSKQKSLSLVNNLNTD